MSRQHATPDHDVLAVMGRVARSMRESDDGTEILQSIVEAACEAVPGADFASIWMTYPDGSFATLAASDDIARKSHRILPETGTEPPDKARAPGMASSMTLEVFRTGSSCAALTMYSKSDDAFAESRQIAELFASQATIALSFVRTTETLHAALASRQTIGQAVGIIMERYQLDEERAFAYLVRTSQDSNIKLRVVAQQTVEQHNREAAATTHGDA